MKAITIHQPWASLIAIGAKKFETRGWATKYRGPIAIHAGKQKDFETCMRLAKEYEDIWNDILPLQFGCIVAIAELQDCYSIHGHVRGGFDLYSSERSLFIGGKAQEIAFGHYSDGRYAWELTNVRQIDPIPAKGQQGLWNWEESHHE